MKRNLNELNASQNSMLGNYNSEVNQFMSVRQNKMPFENYQVQADQNIVDNGYIRERQTIQDLAEEFENKQTQERDNSVSVSLNLPLKYILVEVIISNLLGSGRVHK